MPAKAHTCWCVVDLAARNGQNCGVVQVGCFVVAEPRSCVAESEPDWRVCTGTLRCCLVGIRWPQGGCRADKIGSPLSCFSGRCCHRSKCICEACQQCSAGSWRGIGLTLQGHSLSGQGLKMLGSHVVAEVMMLTHVLGEAVQKRRVSSGSRRGNFEAVGGRVYGRIGVTYLAALLTMVLGPDMLGGLRVGCFEEQENICNSL